MPVDAAEVQRCCAVSYGHPLVASLLGDSLHPGGLDLTSRLAGLLGVGQGASVLDAGSGRGASAVHLSRTLGCRVLGVTLESEGVVAGYELARGLGVRDRVEFVEGDILKLDLRDRRFDFVLMECVLSILSPKPEALRRLKSFLKPGGLLGLTDVTANGALPAEMQGVLATAGCVAGAMPLAGYVADLEAEGLTVEHREDLPEVATSFLGGVRAKLLAVELGSRLGKLAVPPGVLDDGRRLLKVAEALVGRGVLSYGLVVARVPG